MAKIDIDPRLPQAGHTESQYSKDLTFRLNALLRQIAQQINSVSEGTQVAFYTSATSIPTSGTWGTGDFMLNSAPAELGTASSKYIVHGWRCLAGGAPGTWVPCRFLTGN